MVRFSIFLLVMLISVSLSAQKKIMSWGDQGNGTYVNPILNADYSDPDVIRVGEKYYMICSDFHYLGMQVLESDDMVNWKVISQIYSRFFHDDWNHNKRYGAGSWAPSLRFHDDKYWMFVCTPHEGLLMSYATDPKGPWSPLHVVEAAERWEDPCPLWDDNGEAYLGRSQWGGGPIIVHRMSPDGRKLLDEGVTVYTGPVAEGTKFYKMNGYYYISIPEGGVSTGWQTILRSKNIYGPYEKKVVLEQGTTNVNGPHQGALVDTPSGEWWFYHFQATEPLGRVVHLQPVCWKEDWPMIGVDIDMNGIGEPVRTWTKPDINKMSDRFLPQTDDDFSTEKLGYQWQFNHNPDDENWSLSERKGWMMIHSTKAKNLREARNMMTQKCMGYISEAVTELDIKQIADGQRAGILGIGNVFNGAGITRIKGKNYVYLEQNGVAKTICEWKGNRIFLKARFNVPENLHQFYYSANGKDFMTCGDLYSLHSGDWKGIRTGIYSYNVNDERGKVFFNSFIYRMDDFN